MSLFIFEVRPWKMIRISETGLTDQWSFSQEFRCFIVACPHVSVADAKSLQSCLTLCGPIDGSPQAPLTVGFSRQENWSGLPFPSPFLPLYYVLFPDSLHVLLLFITQITTYIDTWRHYNHHRGLSWKITFSREPYMVLPTPQPWVLIIVIPNSTLIGALTPLGVLWGHLGCLPCT